MKFSSFSTTVRWITLGVVPEVDIVFCSSESILQDVLTFFQRIFQTHLTSVLSESCTLKIKSGNLESFVLFGLIITKCES